MPKCCSLSENDFISIIFKDTVAPAQDYVTSKASRWECALLSVILYPSYAKTHGSTEDKWNHVWILYKNVLRYLHMGGGGYYLCLNLYNLNDLHLSNTFGIIWRLWGLTDLFSGDVIAIQAGAVTAKVRRHELRVHPYQRIVTADRGWFSSCASTHYQ